MKNETRDYTTQDVTQKHGTKTSDTIDEQVQQLRDALDRIYSRAHTVKGVLFGYEPSKEDDRDCKVATRSIHDELRECLSTASEIEIALERVVVNIR